MIAFVFRWLFPMAGLGFLAVGLLGAPGRGDPPLASLWGGRAETVVTSGAIIRAGGTWPRTEIRVAWPPGSATEAAVGALGVGARPNRLDLLEAELARFPPGTPIRVRIARGLPHADRTDVFALAWTIGAVLLGGLVAAVGIVLNRALR